jgi:hypothetical protein
VKDSLFTKDLENQIFASPLLAVLIKKKLETRASHNIKISQISSNSGL